MKRNDLKKSCMVFIILLGLYFQSGISFARAIQENDKSVSVPSQSLRLFTINEIKSDLAYLRDTLEASHYNLYAYTKKEIFDSMYKQIDSAIDKPLNSVQVYRLFQPYVALAKMGHCSINYPLSEYFGSYIQQGGTVFPFNLCFSRDRVYIKANFSSDPQFAMGDELISLNEKPIKEVMAGIYDFISGESQQLKNSLIESITFSRLFWCAYDKCDTFKITIRKPDGREITTQVPAITGKNFEKRIAQEKPLFNESREIRFINDVAYLHPGTFLNAGADNIKEHKSHDNSEFQSFIDAAFAEIHKKRAKYLIIDLRNNPGGDNTFSDYMVTYFASKPFCFYSNLTVKTSQITKDFWKDVNDPSLLGLKRDILSHENGARFGVSQHENQPKTGPMRFNGKVYVLINRYSYSNAPSTAAMIQDYRFGSLIGEETADTPTNYGAAHQFKLPNTQLLVMYPKGFIVRPNGDISSNGVIPDYKVEGNIFTDKDEILDFALDLIKKGNY